MIWLLTQCFKLISFFTYIYRKEVNFIILLLWLKFGGLSMVSRVWVRASVRIRVRFSVSDVDDMKLPNVE